MEFRLIYYHKLIVMNKKTQVTDISQLGVKVVGEIKDTLDYLSERGGVRPDKAIYPEFAHFAKRLKERYGLLINQKQYKNLLKRDVLYVRNVKSSGASSTRKLGFIAIQDRVVLVIKETERDGALITALPYNSYTMRLRKPKEQ
jgi:hypothetical protein